MAKIFAGKSMRVVLADPIAYLGTRYEIVVDRKVPAGSYPVELSVCRSRIAGLRIAAARLLFSEFAEQYEAPLYILSRFFGWLCERNREGVGAG